MHIFKDISCIWTVSAGRTLQITEVIALAEIIRPNHFKLLPNKGRSRLKSESLHNVISAFLKALAKRQRNGIKLFEYIRILCFISVAD